MISVVLPVYQNEDTLRDLHRKLKACLQQLYSHRPETLNLDRAKTTGIDDRKEVNIRNIDLFTIVDSREFSRSSKSTFQADGSINHQIIFIDDASKDRSLEIIKELAAQDPCISFFSFSNNQGQHRAVLKGLAIAEGSVVVTMDADLQDSPADIPALLDKMKEGYEAVFAGRKGYYESPIRIATSKIFKFLLHKLTKVPRDAGMFVAMSRCMVDAILQIPMPSPFVVAMIGLTRLRCCSIPIFRQRRPSGISAYTSLMRLKIGIRTLIQTATTQAKLLHYQGQKKYYSRADHTALLPDRYPVYIERHLQEALHYLSLSKQRVLEVGCGCGRFTLPLAQRGIQIEGLDISPALLEQFKTYSKASIPLHCADLSNPPSHLKNQFDVIIGFFVLHHLTDMEEIFQSLSTLLKPNGQILFVEPNPYNPLFYLQILFHPKMRWKNERYILSMRPSILRAAMQSASMQNFKHHRFGFFPPFISQFSWGAKLESTLEKFRPFRKILPFQVFYGEKHRDKL